MASGTIKDDNVLKSKVYSGYINSLRTFGTYEVSNDGQTTDLPSDVVGTADLLVIGTQSLVQQIIFYAGSIIYMRRYNGTWSAWKKTTLS